jgi:hypothetical protein
MQRKQHDRDLADAIAEHDRIMAEAASERTLRPLVRSAAPATLIYKTRENSLVDRAASAPAAAGDMDTDTILDAVGQALAIQKIEEEDERAKLLKHLRRDYEKLQRRIEALEADRRKVLDLPALPLRRHVA